MSSVLWLPDEVENLLLVTVDPLESTDFEWDTMLLLNQSARNWVDGKLDTGTYQDILEAADFDPEWFIGTAEQHVHRLMLQA